MSEGQIDGASTETAREICREKGCNLMQLNCIAALHCTKCTVLCTVCAVNLLCKTFVDATITMLLHREEESRVGGAAAAPAETTAKSRRTIVTLTAVTVSDGQRDRQKDMPGWMDG